MIQKSSLKRGEIWLVNFDPSIGSEIKKSRPAAIITSDVLIGSNKLPNQIVVPLRSWKAEFDEIPWYITITKSKLNNLSNDSIADTTQIKSISNKRFVHKIGDLDSQLLEEIIAGVLLCIDS